MSYSIKEAQEQKVFVIDNGEVEETTLYNHIMESVDITTTPRGVAPREFIEKEEVSFCSDEVIEENEFELERDEYDSDEEFEKDILELHVQRNISIPLYDYSDITLSDFTKYGPDGYNYHLEYYVISSWGVGGNNYKSGKYEWNNSFKSEEEAEQELFNRTYEYDFAKDDQRDTNWFESEIEAYADLWQVDIEVAESIKSKLDTIESIKEQRKIEQRRKEDERVLKLAEIYADNIQPIKGESFKETARRLSNSLSDRIESKVFYKTVKLIRSKS